MEPVDLLELPGTRAICFAKDQPEYQPLPALVYPDGTVLIEWAFSDADRIAVARGENLRLWVWTFGRALQPVQVEMTNEHQS